MRNNDVKNYKFNTIVPEIDYDELEKSLVPEEESVVEKTCRICLDNDSQTKKFISPCRCRGSMKYIHEECLKTWLVSQDENLDSRKCDLCNTELLMEIKIEKKCTPMRILREGMSTCFFIPVSLSIIFILFYLSYIIVLQIIDKGITVLSSVVLAICVIASFSLFGILLFSILDECVTSGLIQWTIFDQDLRDDGDDNSNSCAPDNPVMFIPPSVVIKGRRIKTPVLFSSLHPLYGGSKQAEFSINSPVFCGIRSEPAHPLYTEKSQSSYASYIA